MVIFVVLPGKDTDVDYNKSLIYWSWIWTLFQRHILFYNFLNVEKEIKKGWREEGGNEQEESKAWKNEAGPPWMRYTGGEEAERSPLIMSVSYSVCVSRKILTVVTEMVTTLALSARFSKDPGLPAHQLFKNSKISGFSYNPLCLHCW